MFYNPSTMPNQSSTKRTFLNRALAGIACGFAGLTFCMYTSLHGDLLLNGVVSVAVIGGVLLAFRFSRSKALFYGVYSLMSAWLIHSVGFFVVLMNDSEPMSQGIGTLIAIVYLVYCVMVVLGSMTFTAIAMVAVAFTGRRQRNRI